MYEHALPDDPQRSWEQSYPGTPVQLRHVRRALREFLGNCPPAADAVHLLSELAANAVLHSDSGKTGGTFTARARHVVNDYVHGEVEDQGSDWHGELSASAIRPHGLYLLLSLASACGVDRTGRAGLVWFRLDYPRGPSRPRQRPAAGAAAAIAASALVTDRRTAR
jgi:serine/threonine-protein kinase RsbW